MKKLVCILLVLLQVLLIGSTCFAKVGDVIGYAAYTDIVATINGYQIQSFNVNGNTFVVAEDLAKYGFRVTWNAQEKKLNISRDYKVRSFDVNYRKPSVSKSQIGKRAYNILETDVRVSLNNMLYISNLYDGIDRTYNINGQTIILFDTLSTFGNVDWNPYARELSLTLPAVSHKGYGPVGAADAKNDFLARTYRLNAESEAYFETAWTQMDLNFGAHMNHTNWDVLLNEIYQYLKTYLPANEFEVVKNDEIRWIQEKEAAVEREGKQFEGGSIRPMVESSTASEYTKNRCYELLNYLP